MLLESYNSFIFRFGPIIGVISLRPIEEGEEVFVDYGYKEGPSWYEEVRKEFLKQRNQDEIKENEKLEKNTKVIDDSV